MEHDDKELCKIKPIEVTPIVSGEDADEIINQVLNPGVSQSELKRIKNFYRKLYRKAFKK